MTPAERLGQFILDSDGKPDKDAYKAAVEEAKQAKAANEKRDAYDKFALEKLRTLCRWGFYDGLSLMRTEGARGVPEVLAKFRAVLKAIEEQ